jgi:hypothetical protein
MYKAQFNQADVGGPSKVVCASLADGGLYQLAIAAVSTPGVGADNSSKFVVRWTDALGNAQSTENTVPVDVPSNSGFDNRAVTLQHPSDITAELVPYNEAGNFDVEIHVYLARVREEGND